MIVYISIAIVAAIVYLSIGPIVACLVTDEWDDLSFKVILAIFWPITLIVCLLLVAEPLARIPRKIANKIKHIFKKDQGETKND